MISRAQIKSTSPAATQAAQWHRWRGMADPAAICVRPFHQYPVPVLRTASGPDQGPVLGKEWLHPALQTAGTGRVLVTTLWIRGEDANLAAVPLAHGGAANRTAEGSPLSDVIDRCMNKENVRKPFYFPLQGHKLSPLCEGADFSAPSSCSLRLMPGIE